ncbi:LysM peptidoglycan-binding domain-containing protein [Kocuria tytonis]|uniref:LysM peptidoglycan-binding domain-containing protein n=1 Tax=Kocuria tytonis TaxID=2054280 RepID=A0A495A846_9MICC|nr:LysM peptidoglycan-binding domain-containing protein [Kocuria tytonis]RKQ36156.1 LysM peptidoglycan-binding domain-containing protein [Kocuria tytonis]
MPVDPHQGRPSPRSAWSRRAAQGSAAALAALTALGSADAAQATPVTPQTVHVTQQQHAGHVTVAPGDSVWSLATAHGVSVQALMTANDIPAHGMIRPGQRLALPGSAAAPAHDAAAATSEPAHPVTQRSGSSGGTARHGSAADGAAARPVRTRDAAPVAGHHSVAPGDTLWELSRRHGVSVAELMSANHLSPGALLRPGRVLVLPAGAERQGDAASSTPAGPPHRSAPAGAAPADASGTPGPDGTPPGARPAVGRAFAGREYPREVVASANAHHAQLRRQDVPSPAEIRELVAATARSMGVDPALALAHASQESGFHHDAVSPADAVGTMQVIPSAGRWASAMVGRDLDLLDPQDNITAGVAIIRELQDRAPSKAVGIGAYYQGLHGVKTYGMYSDTKAYVRAVSAQEREFAQ